MYTALGAAEPKQATKSTQRVSNSLGSCWGEFQQRRKRDRLRTELYGLNDRELMDIGITRGEIDYFASNRGIDPSIKGCVGSRRSRQACG
jgi:uncharacterized protein YjiS (DUF1127 family)